MTAWSSLSTCALGAAALAIWGCGGGSDNAGGGSCGQIQPCGGNVVGTWMYQNACANLAAYSAELAATCPGASISVYKETISGTLIFGADLTFSLSDGAQTIATTTSSPLSCASTATCADQNENQTTSNATVVNACTGTTTCTCQRTLTASGLAETGTYSVSGSVITMVSPGVTILVDYCVEGDRLHEIGLGTMTGPSGQPPIVGDTVLRRR